MKEIIINKLLDGKLNIKDYSTKNIIECYEKFINEENIDLEDKAKMNEIDRNLDKLLNSLC